MTDIEALGLNTVNVPVQIDIPSLTANTATINTESEKKARQLIKKLRYQGINVILEPYPYIKNGELYETQLDPADKEEWCVFRRIRTGIPEASGHRSGIIRTVNRKHPDTLSVSCSCNL